MAVISLLMDLEYRVIVEAFAIKESTLLRNYSKVCFIVISLFLIFTSRTYFLKVTKVFIKLLGTFRYFEAVL